MPDIRMRLNRDIIVVDGALGTMLQREGIPDGECSMLLNVLDPELILQVYKRYLMAGAQAITTNSFGGTRAKLRQYGLEDRVSELNRAAVRLARQARPEHVFADVGSCGLLLEPLGAASFEEVFDQYAEQVSALASENPDAILIETMADIADARCAVLAAKSVCDLPVFVSCTFDATGHIELSGTEPEAAAVILEAVGADAVGLNCGLGPEQLLPLARRMAQATSLPLIIQPNAGIPQINKAGMAVYTGTADDFADAAVAFRDLGAQFIGSCCGSNPAFTGAIYATVGGMDVKKRPSPTHNGRLVLASPQRTVVLGPGQPTQIIGERINPTGKPRLAAELEKGSMSLVREFGNSQEAAGATLIDVNVGAPLVDANLALPSAAQALQGLVSCPLVFDTTDYDALEKALRVYPGKALINSVNGDAESYDRVFPLVRTYGAAFIALCLDAAGIPDSVEGRLQIAERIREAAHGYGIEDKDIIFDVLTLTAATDSSAPLTTLEAVRRLNENGLSTVLGVSNVSHGLPERSSLNAAFVSAAIAAGLSAAIANPNDPVMSESVNVANAEEGGLGSVEAQAEWEKVFSRVMKRAQEGSPKSEAPAEGQGSTKDDISLEDLLKKAVLRGDRDAVPALVDAVIEEGLPAASMVESLLTPALHELGSAFAKGEAFLPQMMLAAGAMKTAVEHIKRYLPDTKEDTAFGKVLFCTVKGDVHSIGKDICIALLESQGFVVYDLGVDAPVEKIVATAREECVDAICLSALMTTSLPSMQTTVETIYRELPEYSLRGKGAVAVGGAVVNERWAESISARYASDAPGCVALVKSIIEESSTT